MLFILLGAQQATADPTSECQGARDAACADREKHWAAIEAGIRNEHCAERDRWDGIEAGIRNQHCAEMNRWAGIEAGIRNERCGWKDRWNGIEAGIRNEACHDRNHWHEIESGMRNAGSGQAEIAAKFAEVSGRCNNASNGVQQRFNELNGKCNQADAVVKARFAEVNGKCNQADAVVKARFAEVSGKCNQADAVVKARFAEVSGRCNAAEAELEDCLAWAAELKTVIDYGLDNTEGTKSVSCWTDGPPVRHFEVPSGQKTGEGVDVDCCKEPKSDTWYLLKPKTSNLFSTKVSKDGSFDRTYCVADHTKGRCSACKKDPGLFGYCGIGFELIFILPPIMWLWRRRTRRVGQNANTREPTV